MPLVLLLSNLAGARLLAQQYNYFWAAYPSAATLSGNQGVAVDPAGNVWVADTANDVIWEIPSTGLVSGSAIQIAGNLAVPGLADASGTNALFNLPTGIAVDASGNVYVADSGNDAIREITSQDGGNTWNVTTIAGKATVDNTVSPPVLTPVAGYADGPGTNALFNTPTGIAVDADGNLYVADTANDVIREISPSGNVTTIAGNVVVDNTQSPPVATPTAGAADGFGTGALLNGPTAVAVDAHGNIFVADTQNSIVREITPQGMVTTIAGLALATGTNDGVGANAQLNLPTGVAVDGSGNVYVADGGNSTVRIIAPGGIVTTINTNAFGFGTSMGIAVTPGGLVFVADAGNSQVVMGDPNGASGAAGPLAPTLNLIAVSTAPVLISTGADPVLFDSDFANAESQVLTAYPPQFTITACSQPSLGSVGNNADGTFTYFPNINFRSFAGVDTFTYVVTDGASVTGTGIVNIGNPFYLEKGNFEGLMTNRGGGFLTLSVTSNGAFTGKLRLGASALSKTTSAAHFITYSLHGQFDTTGAYSVTLGGKLLSVSLDMTQMTGNGNGNYVIQGSYDNSGFTLRHVLYNSSSNPAPEVGSYTLMINDTVAINGVQVFNQTPPQIALSQATANVGFSHPGSISSVQVTNGGSGYLSIPQVTATSTSGNGSGFVGQAVVSNGRVVGVNIIHAGTGYDNTASVTIDPPSGYPQGMGYATIVVNESGAASISGRMPDGMPFTAAVYFTGGKGPNSNQLPVFVGLGYKTYAGSLTGPITFEMLDQTQNLSGNVIATPPWPGKSDCDGSLIWNKPEQALSAGPLYQQGFVITVPAIGSRYAASPASSGTPLAGLIGGAASVQLNEADWDPNSLTNPLSPIADALTYTAPSAGIAGNWAGSGSENFTVNIKANTGLFTGSFIDPVTLQTRSIFGILLPGMSCGAGFYLTPTQSGSVIITPSM